MDASVIGAYLVSKQVVGKPAFEQFFTNHFTENVHISRPSPTFFMMVFLGFNNILIMDEIRTSYNIEKVFFGWYPEFNAVKSIILTNQNGKRILKSRTIFLNEIPKGAPRLFLKEEISEMARNLAEYQYEKEAFDKYNNDLASGIIHDMTFENYYQSPPANSEDRQSLHEEIEKDLIDRIRESKEYLLKEYKSDTRKETSRSHISLTEIFNSKSVIKNGEFNIQRNHIPNINQLFEQSVNFEINKLILMDSSIFFAELPIDILTNYRDLHSVDFVAEEEKEYMEDFLTALSEFYLMHTQSLGLPNMKSESRECAYTLGASLALTDRSDYPPHVKALQHSIEITNNDEEDQIGRSEAFFLVIEPGFQSSINNMAEKLPIIITFSADSVVTPEMIHSCRLQNKIQSKYLLLKVDYFSGEEEVRIIPMQQSNNFITKIVELNGLERGEVEQKLKTNLDEVFNEIQPIQLEQRLTDVTYLSRYTFGALISAERTADGLVVQEMRPKKAGQFETSFVMSWPERGSDPASPRKHIILNFVEHVDTDGLADPRSEATENFDTLFVHITQNFKTSPNDPHLGNIERSVNIHRAYFRSFERDMVFEPLSHLSVDELRFGRTSIQSFHTDLINALSKHDHLIKEPSLPGKQHLIESSSNFEAVIDGIFHCQPSMKNIIKIPKHLSSVQYTVPVEIHEIMSLMTLNFKYTTNEKFDRRDLSDGANRMAVKISRVTKDNMIVNSYFISGSANEDPNDLMIRKDVPACNGRRRRRGIPIACVEERVENKKFEKPEVTDATLKRLEILNDIATVCHYAGQALMIRDLISDVYHENTLNALKDTGFLVTTALSPRLSSYLIEKGGTMVENGMKIGGYATKALGFGVSRAISLYVFYDFIKNAVDYANNPNDTSAKANMAVDGAFVAIDVIVLGIEGLAAAGLISGGIATIANPIGAAIGAALIIGLNVYQAVQTVEHIQKFVTLNDQELIDESLRAFFHLDPATNIQEVISEEQANGYLKDQATDFLLQHQDQFDVFIRKSGVVEGKSIKVKDNAIVDLQHIWNINISRASPKSDEKFKLICALHQEAKEIQSPTFWSKVDGFFAKIGHSVKSFYHLLSSSGFHVIVKDAIDDKLEGQIRGYGYICHNSFGLRLTNSTPGKAAYFDLGDGNDMIDGFANKSNFFHLGSGRKYINGSERNDVFILEHLNITGILNGDAGQDTVDISRINSTDHFIMAGDGHEDKNVLMLKNIETVIGRSNIPDTVICGCSFRTVRMLGGSKAQPDLVIAADQNCSYEMVLYLDDNTEVKINEVRGNFTYLINKQSEIKLEITNSEQSLATHTMIINDSFLLLKKITSTIIDGLFISKFTFANERNLFISRSSNESLVTYFKDGCQVMLTKSETAHVVLNSNLSIRQIDRFYAEKVRELGIPLVAFSAVVNETMMISSKTHEGPNIVQNSLFSPTRLFIENCGNHLLLVKATDNNDELLFPAINLLITKCSCSSLTIDLNLIIEQLEKLNNSENVDLNTGSLGDNLSVFVFKRSTSLTLKAQFIGKITVIDAFKNQCYKNITIRSYNDLSVLDKTFLKKTVKSDLLNSEDLNEQAELYIHNLLEPQPLIYTSNYKFIHLSNLNTEWFNKIYINAKLSRLEFFHSNATSLFITNMRTLDESETINVCSIYVENFYVSKKLWTLIIRAMDSRTRLFFLKKSGAVRSIDTLFKFYENYIRKIYSSM